MKHLWFLVLPAILVASCKTSTVESRKQERSMAYAALSSEYRSDVDAARIRIGMNADAVYMAWGKPAQILESENESTGRVTTWLYEGGWIEEQRYWAYRSVGKGDRLAAERYLEREYYPRAYISAEITFVDGAVKQWRMLPKPTY